MKLIKESDCKYYLSIDNIDVSMKNLEDVANVIKHYEDSMIILWYDDFSTFLLHQEFFSFYENFSLFARLVPLLWALLTFFLLIFLLKKIFLPIVEIILPKWIFSLLGYANFSLVKHANNDLIDYWVYAYAESKIISISKTTENIVYFFVFLYRV